MLFLIQFKTKIMAKKDNPKLRKNGGPGTFLGNALRTLKDVSPAILDIIGTVVPGVSGLSTIASAIIGDKDTPQETKDLLLAEIQKDIAVEQEITKRWESDNKQEHWLPRLIRPLVLANYTILVDVVVLNGIWGQPLEQMFMPLLLSLAATVTGGYFALREFGKTKRS